MLCSAPHPQRPALWLALSGARAEGTRGWEVKDGSKEKEPAFSLLPTALSSHKSNDDGYCYLCPHRDHDSYTLVKAPFLSPPPADISSHSPQAL